MRPFKDIIQHLTPLHVSQLNTGIDENARREAGTSTIGGLCLNLSGEVSQYVYCNKHSDLVFYESQLFRKSFGSDIIVLIGNGVARNQKA
jgi:hypothetical protein